MKPLCPSLRWRIFLFYSVLFAIALGILVAVQIRDQVLDQEQMVAMALQSKALELMPLVFPPPNRLVEGRPTRAPESDPIAIKARQQFIDLADNCRSKDWFILTVDRSGTPIFDNGIVPKDFAVPPRYAQAPGLSTLHAGGYLASEISSPLGERIFVGTSTNAMRAEMAPRHAISILFGLGIFAAVNSFGWWLLRHGLRPIAELSATAKRIAASNLAERLDVPAQSSELAELASTLNKTFDRLQDHVLSQTRFTADASHELRTPVAAILAECRLAFKQERTAERYRESLEVCLECAQHIREIIERLGLLARLDESSSTLSLETVAIGDLFRDVLAIVRPQADEKQITIVADTPELRIRVDRLRLTQAIVNLAQNAILYNHLGGAVRICGGADGDNAWFEVNDTGVGIAPAHVPRIFERFYRVDESRSKPGSGLGLAICQSIIHAHGGRITVQSTPGVGTTFRVELPGAVFA